VLELFPETKSGRTTDKETEPSIFGKRRMMAQAGSSGSAARFFYCAKASRSEREAGCEGMGVKSRVDYGGDHSEQGLINNNRNPENRKPTTNNHPTVKPLALMRYLCRLVTPPGGTILDPFMGSGTTGMAAKQEGFEFIGIEKEKEYVDIAERRMGSVLI
jgi:site-specific DNA-methyltransferase (adenine-specific)